MKKVFASMALLTMCISSFVACSNNADSSNGESDLTAARKYLYAMYKSAAETTPADYNVVGVVSIGGVAFDVDWTVDSQTVKIVPNGDKTVTIDVDEANPEEVTYTLTATLKDAEGATESVSFTRKVPAAIIIEEGMSYAEIVDLAYGLEDGMALDGSYRLYGTITNIDTPYSADYKNITVTIAVEGKEDKPVMCYRLKGDGAENLAVGDAITVEGVFKNYKGTIEFDAGCVLLGMGEHKDYTALLEAAYALEDGLSMQEPCTMTGVISKIDTPYSADYKNITVTIVVNGDETKPIMCYRLKGEGAENLVEGDTITVTGTIKNYKGTIEFDAGCTLE